MKSKNEIPGEISLDQSGSVLSHSVQLLDILGEAECRRIIGHKLDSFLVNNIKVELGRYFVEFEKLDLKYLNLAYGNICVIYEIYYYDNFIKLLNFNEWTLYTEIIINIFFKSLNQ